jgi:chemotaxis protein CheD
LARTAAIGEVIISGLDDAVLAARGLGSCVALTAWDPVSRVGGLAHFMLPSGSRAGNPAKYVDTGVPWFLAALSAAGARPRRSHFKAAGGAAMFVGVSGALEVGRRNVDAVQESLAAAGLRLTAHDLGGRVGRSIELDLANGQVRIGTIHGTSIL